MPKRIYDEKLPDYLRKYGDRSPDIDPEHLLWIGDDLDLDTQVLLAEKGYEPQPPLDLILLAIIDANPIENGVSRQARLETALEALTGIKRKRGMDELDDYDILLDIAWCYFLEWVRDKEVVPEVTPIIRSVVSRCPKSHELRRGDDDSVIRRLRRKFRKDRDLLLARVTSETDWDRMETLNAVDEVLRRMKALGIEVAPEVVQPRLRLRDAKGNQ